MMLFGREFRTSLSSIVGYPEPEKLTPMEHLKVRANNFTKIFIEAEQKHQAYQRRTAKTYQENNPLKDQIRIGQLVWAWSPLICKE